MICELMNRNLFFHVKSIFKIYFYVMLKIKMIHIFLLLEKTKIKVCLNYNNTIILQYL